MRKIYWIIEKLSSPEAQLALISFLEFQQPKENTNQNALV